ncbi:DUF418 domain-containing protein [Confluentibacter sediminis]|uniref:DUF418 domain-containing protein n=1 Tax=Confluentibacter sediminis TaxID=2219045 RepID=UPI000DAED2E0|nr:DUF418 domain-containing protein [Confluentibacter sediminis]
MIESESKLRIGVIDAIRGFCLVSIMLLHNLEHFDFYYKPKFLPDWMVSLDTIIWDILFFLFSGKSYAIFAFLFGFTFYIQLNNQEKRGNDFRLRFFWRLVLLFCFGFINSAFYQGDILSIYAFVGLFLIPFAKTNSKIIFLIACILFLQPYELFQLYKAFQNPNLQIPNPESWIYFGKMEDYITGDSFFNTIKGNLTNGRKAVWLWSFENGRFFHILSLFMFGMIAGRKQLFTWTDKNKLFWKKVFYISSILFIPLFIIQKSVIKLIESKAIRTSLENIETSWTNITFMLILISGFILLFHNKHVHSKLNVFSPLGKMSLSNYVLQSLLGACIYYGFGLGLYKYTGATFSLIIGILSSILLLFFCKWWLKTHKRGPLETIWHKATWVFSK